MSAYVRSAEIIRRLKLEMPISVTLPDVMTGKPFTIQRDNVLSLLAIDTENILVEGQSLAAFYVEMARAQRACQKAHQQAEMDFRRWKAKIAHELRGQRSTLKEKPPTVAEVEETYRLDPEYESKAMLGPHYEALAGLFEDVKRGFDIKGRISHDQTTMMLGHERAVRADDELDRLQEMESIEHEVEQIIATKPAKGNSQRKPRAL